MPVVHHTGSEQMHDAFEARISAWVDGQDDIRPEDMTTPYARQVWDVYHLIGDVLRNDELAVRPSPLFYARLSKAIDIEPAVLAPARWRSPRVILSGLALAAVVASVAWVVLPYVIQTDDVAARGQAVLASASDDGALGDYLQAHREIYGAGIMRRASLSRVTFETARP